MQKTRSPDAFYLADMAARKPADAASPEWQQVFESDSVFETPPARIMRYLNGVLTHTIEIIRNATTPASMGGNLSLDELNKNILDYSGFVEPLRNLATAADPQLREMFSMSTFFSNDGPMDSQRMEVDTAKAREIDWSNVPAYSGIARYGNDKIKRRFFRNIPTRSLTCDVAEYFRYTGLAKKLPTLKRLEGPEILQAQLACAPRIYLRASDIRGIREAYYYACFCELIEIPFEGHMPRAIGSVAVAVTYTGKTTVHVRKFGLPDVNIENMGEPEEVDFVQFVSGNPMWTNVRSRRAEKDYAYPTWARLETHYGSIEADPSQGSKLQGKEKSTSMWASTGFLSSINGARKDLSNTARDKLQTTAAALREVVQPPPQPAGSSAPRLASQPSSNTPVDQLPRVVLPPFDAPETLQQPLANTRKQPNATQKQAIPKSRPLPIAEPTEESDGDDEVEEVPTTRSGPRSSGSQVPESSKKGTQPSVVVDIDITKNAAPERIAASSPSNTPSKLTPTVKKTAAHSTASTKQPAPIVVDDADKMDVDVVRSADKDGVSRNKKRRSPDAVEELKGMIQSISTKVDVSFMHDDPYKDVDLNYAPANDDSWKDPSHYTSALPSTGVNQLLDHYLSDNTKPRKWLHLEPLKRKPLDVQGPGKKRVSKIVSVIVKIGAYSATNGQQDIKEPALVPVQFLNKPHYVMSRDLVLQMERNNRPLFLPRLKPQKFLSALVDYPFMASYFDKNGQFDEAKFDRDRSTLQDVRLLAMDWAMRCNNGTTFSDIFELIKCMKPPSQFKEARSESIKQTVDSLRGLYVVVQELCCLDKHMQHRGVPVANNYILAYRDFWMKREKAKLDAVRGDETANDLSLIEAAMTRLENLYVGDPSDLVASKKPTQANPPSFAVQGVYCGSGFACDRQVLWEGDMPDETAKVAFDREPRLLHLRPRVEFGLEKPWETAMNLVLLLKCYSEDGKSYAIDPPYQARTPDDTSIQSGPKISAEINDYRVTVENLFKTVAIPIASQTRRLKTNGVLILSDNAVDLAEAKLIERLFSTDQAACIMVNALRGTVDAVAADSILDNLHSNLMSSNRVYVVAFDNSDKDEHAAWFNLARGLGYSDYLRKALTSHGATSKEDLPLVIAFGSLGSANYKQWATSAPELDRSALTWIKQRRDSWRLISETIAIGKTDPFLSDLNVRIAVDPVSHARWQAMQLDDGSTTWAPNLQHGSLEDFMEVAFDSLEKIVRAFLDASKATVAEIGRLSELQTQWYHALRWSTMTWAYYDEMVADVMDAWSQKEAASKTEPVTVMVQQEVSVQVSVM